jgi:SAM-dependent methyltransferase
MAKRSASARQRATPAPRPAAPTARARGELSGALARPLFAGVIALAAFLLFTLELLSGRLVLPAFGGSPGVWATALSFFTAVLFLGYAYAHVVATRLGRRAAGLVHGTVALVALGAAIVAPREIGALRFAGLAEALNVLVVLALVAGLPAFLFATTSPLLSAWYAGRGDDPWWLYAASNAASLLALIVYPFLLEPTLGLSAQRTLVTGGVAVLVVLLFVVIVAGRRAPATGSKAVGDDPPPSLGRRRQWLWLAAAFVPAGLLSATTNFLSVDLVSAPLLWVGPLGIYLSSFVVAFSAVGRRLLPIVERLVPAAATFLWVPYVSPLSWPVAILVVAELLAYGILAVAIHGRLALDRPDPRHLTRFYLILSLGGLLATGFVALIAPVVFRDVYEYPLLVVAALVLLDLLPGPAAAAKGRGFTEWAVAAGKRVLPLAVAGLVIVVLVGRAEPGSALLLGGLLALGGGLVALLRRPAALALGTAGVFVVAVLVVSPQPVHQVRTFFGVIRVNENPPGVGLEEVSGTTLHGFQFLDDRRAQPTTYYTPQGPLGDVFDDLRQRTAAASRGASIGVVGLGVGTIAAYARPGDALTFFEIDRAVVEIALDGRFFTYLADAPVPARIVVGDGRLSIAAEPEDSFDVIVLDAFASDSVPAHLLTREAMATYARALRPDGIIAFHLSNRSYDLVPAVGTTARASGLSALALSYEPGPANRERFAARGSIWVVVGERQVVRRFEARGWSEPTPGPILTDDFFDVLRLLRSDLF